MGSLRSVIREFIEEVIAEAVIKRDDQGRLVIRKVMNYHKPSTRFHQKDVVDAEVMPSGEVVVDDVETWQPELDPPADRIERRKRRHKQLRAGKPRKATDPKP